jgi:hypothetical protein
MATTYKLISSITVGATAVASVEFTSIPDTYTDLVVVLSGRSDTIRSSDGNYAQISFNGSTANRSSRYLYNYNGTLESGGSGSTSILGWNVPSDYTANTFGNNSWYIPNYASSNFKSVSVDTVQENNSSNILMGLTAGLFSSASAITSVKISNEGTAKFVQYTTAYLYGISNA